VEIVIVSRTRDALNVRWPLKDTTARGRRPTPAKSAETGKRYTGPEEDRMRTIEAAKFAAVEYLHDNPTSRAGS
jgi:hypothetical protein